jgi:hypothetical protein
MSKHGSPRDEKVGENLRSQLESEKYASRLLHSDLLAKAQSQGLWTFLPLFIISPTLLVVPTSQLFRGSIS